MPGAHFNTKPEPAEELSACNEESQLELHLQRQLEEDVASDAYTECNIQHQESEIITYLDNNLNLIQTTDSGKTIVGLEEPEVFLTPKSVSPCVDKAFQKVTDSSPSTELTKEYYALVPIERNLLEKELIEQDALSNAFQCIIKAQTEDYPKVAQRKPTSLSLTSSHTSKTVKHSNSCDILNKNCVKDSISSKPEQIIANKITSHDCNTNQAHKENYLNDSNIVKNSHSCDLSTEKGLDPAYSPDSLITDEPSSSSDYLSAAYTCSPGVSASGHLSQLNVGINSSNMENIFTLSDSGLGNTAMLESVNVNKDVTLTDVSLSESTLHDLATDDASNSAVSLPSPLGGDIKHSIRSVQSGTSSEIDFNEQSISRNLFREMSGKSLKEEKQRQNEEIVILESSSLSSETGSWESVYPPKFAEKEVCENFLLHERQYCFSEKSTVLSSEYVTGVGAPPLNIKSTSCFIDASSLVDDDDGTIHVRSMKKKSLEIGKLDSLPIPSQPVPCSSNKVDISPNEWSEGNDNDDSLEQADKKDPDSIQKDLSPTIFEMTPITEDSLCGNSFDTATHLQHASPDKVNDADDVLNYASEKIALRSSTIFMTSTPNNSIMSLKTHRQYELDNSKLNKELDSPPILSGGVSIEDHLPQIGSRENSPLPAWKLEEVPIVSGAIVTEHVDSHQEKHRATSSSAWVVDMSIDPKSEENLTTTKHCDDSMTEKKNIFSIYIDLSEKTTLKDMPARLSSSMNSKKGPCVESKSSIKSSKGPTNIINDTNFSEKTDISKQSVTIFEKYESLCNDPNISISEIISIPVKHKVMPRVAEDSGKQSRSNKGAGDLALSLTATTIQEEATVADLQSSDLFVKLSDLDKPVQKSDTVQVNDIKEADVRMTRSIPDNNWCEQQISASSKSIEVISSFHSENALSLNRLFPHLKNEFSRSMPGSLSSRTRSPLRLGVSSILGDADEPASDMSEMSSMQSSICRSGFGNSTTDSQTSSLIENCTSRLGQDLLRMFLEEIAPDVIVEVSGKRFKAHKCILSSRCQYFAGILSGGWVESLGNVIVLPPFSYNVVYFALCHIYSGLATIPDSVSIVELATIADMLGLEGLKEAIMFTLKAKYCHHFHKPCAVCIAGVLECFPLSSVYGLDDLYHKCLKWITKHFYKVWPTKAFATLPTDLLDKCYQRQMVNLTVDGLVDTVFGCGITVASLQNSRWAESVARMCRRLFNAAANFAAARLSAVLRALAPLPADAPHAAKQTLDDCIMAAIEWAPPEEACRAYFFLCTLVKEIRNHHYSKPDLISNGTDAVKPFGPHNLLYAYAAGWRLHCEGALVRGTPRVVTTQAFKDLPVDLRKRLRELGCIRYEGHDTNPTITAHDRKSRSACLSKNNKSCNSSTSRSVDIAQVRASFVPYSQKPVLPLGSMDQLRSSSELRDFRKLPSCVPPKVRTTKAQEERAKFNKYKNNKSQDRLNKAPSIRVPSFESTKPRYLEPKLSKDKKMPAVRKMFDSSSESSCNSSPIQLRNAKGCQLKVRAGQSHARDSPAAASSRPRTAEPSTDSLSESQTSNKYATFTKAKHTQKGSTESIKLKCHNNTNPSKPLNNANKMKTKIPIYLNKNSTREPQKYPSLSSKTTTATSKSIERKLPGSLMNATKSSSAKVVPKVVKDPPSNRPCGRSQKSTHVSRQQRDDIPSLADIPMMERSGTFLKEEPTFGDKTTNIDIDQ